MHRSIPAFYLFFLSWVPLEGIAQFTMPRTFGGPGNENGRELLSDQEGGFYVTGDYDASYAPTGVTLPVYGEQDLFLGQLDAAGNWQWIKGLGSFLEDRVTALRRMPDGGLLLAGTFWLELTFEDYTLAASDNIKGIFLLRLDERGEWEWGKVINGADLKEISDVRVAGNGDIFLTGHFSEALQFDTLQLTAAGRNDAYLLQLDGQGDLIAHQQLGYRGLTRGQTIALHPDGGYYWGGVYDDTLQIDTTLLYANTFDRDIFLTRYDAAGKVLWARRAGGVFEEELIAMTTDAQGELLATGFLIGVMNLSEEISVQSRNGNPDLFLFKYSEEGEVRWARSIGGDLIDLPSTLCLLGEQLIIGGTYQGQISWDDLSTPLSGGVSGFVAGFDAADGSGRWLAPVVSERFAFVESVSVDARQQLFVLGSFQDAAQVGAFAINSPGQYNFFLSGIQPEVTPVGERSPGLDLRVFPNPAGDFLYLDGLQSDPGIVRIYDLGGRIVHQQRTDGVQTRIHVAGFPAGRYQLLIRQGERWTTVSVLIH